MSRTVSFVIEGKRPTRVVVSANLDGTLTFELTRPADWDGGWDGDVGAAALEAVFFDLSRPVPLRGLRVYGDAGVCARPFVPEGVDTLGRRVTVRQQVVDPLGDFDIGLYFGRLPAGNARARSVGFTLAHDAMSLSLDMFDCADFGLRYRQPAGGRVERAGVSAPALPSGTPHTGAARTGGWSDALAIIDMHEANAAPLARDGCGALAVIDVRAEDAPIVVTEGAPQPEPADWYVRGDAGSDRARSERRPVIKSGHWSGLSPLG